jgi:HPt (histidine-containing phosphotransfer) domain-containing protein
MEEEIIDLKDVLERVQDDKELLAELFDIYQEDFVIKRKALGDAVAAHDITKIKEIAHSMKGSSGNISAKSLHAACVKLETLAKAGKTDGMLEVTSEIDGYFEAIKVFAARFKKDIGLS